jgi:mono/diheme cytochrome c family protein
MKQTVCFVILLLLSVTISRAQEPQVARSTCSLTTPHAGMPMFILSPEQRQDIIAYILSLKAGN